MLKKHLNRKKRHWKIQKRMVGTAEKPRLAVKKSLKNLYAQAIDDIEGRILYGVGTVSKEVKKSAKYGGNVAAAKELGKVCAAGLKEKGVQKIAFDRAGYLYHGRIKVFADTLREEGIQF